MRLPSNLFIFLLGILFSSCFKPHCDFVVAEFNPLLSLNGQTELHLNGSETAQTDEIKFSFTVRNTTGNPQRLFYKIFYQNESGKNPEKDSASIMSRENPLACENFYGSWGDDRTFVSTDEIPADDNFHKVESSFRIVGNPRNEKEFFVQKQSERKFSENEVARMLEKIKSIPEWHENIKTKAINEKRSLDEQMQLDALYALNEDWQKELLNNKRNGTIKSGNYSFLLVVTTGDNLGAVAIPDYVQNISLKNKTRFVNPYYFFLYGRASNVDNVIVVKSQTQLKITAKAG